MYYQPVRHFGQPPVNRVIAPNLIVNNQPFNLAAPGLVYATAV